jgi:hypothetical protein
MPCAPLLSVTSVALAIAAAPPGLDADTSRVLTNLVAAAAAKDKRIDVVSSEDLRRALEVEGEKQAAGCDEQQSCLAEIAAAMGARVVLYGSTATLDDELVVTLQLFDSENGQSGGRAVARATTSKALARALADETEKLVAAYLRERPPAGAARVRLLVLDLKGTASPLEQGPVAGGAAAAALPVLPVVGGVVAGLGVVAAGAGAVLDAAVAAPADARARDKGTTAVDAQRAFAERDGAASAALWLYASGAVLAAVGGGAVVVGLVQGGE